MVELKKEAGKHGGQSSEIKSVGSTICGNKMEKFYKAEWLYREYRQIDQLPCAG